MKKLFTLSLLAISALAYSQAFTGISIKSGTGIAGHSNTFEKNDSGFGKIGFGFFIEPTIIRFGKTKQCEFNTELAFIQKGFNNMQKIPLVDANGQVIGIGSEKYSFTLSYLSLSPTLKLKFAKIAFVKFGPRIDYLLDKKYKGRYPYYNGVDNKFNSVTGGITYGAGICVGKNRVKFIAEVIGQNDFSQSSYSNVTEEYYRNYCYYINCGVNIGFGKKD